MRTIATAAKSTGVRAVYSQDAVWRGALGNSARLYTHAVFGESLDAPEHLPGGSTVNHGQYGNWQRHAYRED